MHASTVAIDLAKEVFELAFADAQGRIIERKRLSRRAFIRSLETRPPLRVLMEACGQRPPQGRIHDCNRTASRRSTIRYGNDCLTEESIHELLGAVTECQD